MFIGGMLALVAVGPPYNSRNAVVAKKAGIAGAMFKTDGCILSDIKKQIQVGGLSADKQRIFFQHDQFALDGTANFFNNRIHIVGFREAHVEECLGIVRDLIDGFAGLDASQIQ